MASGEPGSGTFRRFVERVTLVAEASSSGSAGATEPIFGYVKLFV